LSIHFSLGGGIDFLLKSYRVQQVHGTIWFFLLTGNQSTDLD
jgi:hypothetical protein